MKKGRRLTTPMISSSESSCNCLEGEEERLPRVDPFANLALLPLRLLLYLSTPPPKADGRKTSCSRLVDTEFIICSRLVDSVDIGWLWFESECCFHRIAGLKYLFMYAGSLIGPVLMMSLRRNPTFLTLPVDRQAISGVGS